MTFSYNFHCRYPILRCRNTAQALTCPPGGQLAQECGIQPPAISFEGKAHDELPTAMVP